MTVYHDAIKECVVRYRDMLDIYIDNNDYYGWRDYHKRQPANDLSKFLKEVSKGCDDKLPITKLNRWLGYIQGSIIQWGLTTVEAERNFTRPLFRPLDFPTEHGLDGKAADC